jgi:hypothetical protein
MPGGASQCRAESAARGPAAGGFAVVTLNRVRQADGGPVCLEVTLALRLPCSGAWRRGCADDGWL